jgi:hypothetical protein
MPIGIIFWFLMILWLVSYFGVWWGVDARVGYVNSILLWFVIACLGWAVFGAMVKG